MKDKRTFQFKAVIEGALIADEKKRLERIRETLLGCGLDKEAYNVQQDINKCVDEQKKAMEKAKKQRLKLVREMLLCFAAADIATECADNVAYAFDDVAYGKEKSDGNSFAELFRLQAKDLNKCVQLVDGECGDDRVSYLYADMAEEINNKVIPIMYEIIDRYMNSEKGKKIL